jgi:hypothetical protein
MRATTHPLAPLAEALRQIILSADAEIGEEVKWNAPAFFFTGPMRAFDPKQYKRHVAVFNLHRKDCIRLIFPSGARIGDTSGLLEGDYADGRRLACFSGLEDARAKEGALQAAIRAWLASLDRG